MVVHRCFKLRNTLCCHSSSTCGKREASPEFIRPFTPFILPQQKRRRAERKSVSSLLVRINSFFWLKRHQRFFPHNPIGQDSWDSVKSKRKCRHRQTWNSELPLPQTFKSMPGTLIAGKPLTQRHRETSCSTNSVLTMSPPKTPRSTRASARSLEPVTPNKSRKSDVPSAPVKTSKAKKMMTLPWVHHLQFVKHH